MKQRAFTLIELLVVIALVGALAVVIVPALYRDNPAAGMRSAEASIAGLMVKARSTAVLNRRDTRIIVSTDATRPDAYLGIVAIIVGNESKTVWTLHEEPYRLPESVRIVPNTNVPIPSGVEWPAAVKSVFDGTETRVIEGFDGSSYGFINFNAVGATSVGQQIVISPARKTPAGWEFYLPNEVRSFLLRATGNFVLLKDKESI